MLVFFLLSMVSSGRNSNQTMRLSDYFDRQDSLQLLMDGNNFDALTRGLATQLQKRADSNIDREVLIFVQLAPNVLFYKILKFFR